MTVPWSLKKSGLPRLWKRHSNGYIEGVMWVNGRWRKIAQHRWLMEQQLGRKLKRSEHVHHKNGDRADNHLRNLEVIPIGDHIRTHARALGHTIWPGDTPAERQRLAARAYRTELRTHKRCQRCGRPALFWALFDPMTKKLVDTRTMSVCAWHRTIYTQSRIRKRGATP